MRPSLRANGSARSAARLSEAIQTAEKDWIASSQVLLAMTAVYSCFTSNRMP
jgi:hypothetical protein